MNLFLEGQQAGGSPYFLLIMVAVMFVFIYFFQYRPNKKRQAEYQKLIASLEVGGEVLLNGGLIGTITRIRAEDDLILVEIAPGVNITTKRGFVVQLLPAGTIESINAEEASVKKELKSK